MLFKHIKTGGLYELIEASATYEEDTDIRYAVYRSLDTGRVWVRSHEEFFDGRFEFISNATAPFNPLADVAAFHAKYKLFYDGQPRKLPTELAKFRVSFFQEEIAEWVEHHNADHDTNADYAAQLDGQLDAIVDLLYVVLGTAHLQGFDRVLPEAWRRVHRANMNKVRAPSAAASKRGSTLDVIKPPGWQAPSHLDLVEHNDVSDGTL